MSIRSWLFGKNPNFCRDSLTGSEFDAVILVDMQDGFVGLLNKNALERILPAQKTVLSQCAKNDIPVIVLEYRGYGQTIEELQQHVQSVPRVVTIQKRRDNGFLNTGLDKTLRELEVKNILFTGINAGYCVLDTAKSALKHGYNIITSPHLIAGQPNHDRTDHIEWYMENGSIISV